MIMLLSPNPVPVGRATATAIEIMLDLNGFRLGRQKWRPFLSGYKETNL
jgi:hypothetical protein